LQKRGKNLVTCINRILRALVFRFGDSWRSQLILRRAIDTIGMCFFLRGQDGMIWIRLHEQLSDEVRWNINVSSSGEIMKMPFRRRIKNRKRSWNFRDLRDRYSAGRVFRKIILIFYG
jgi:hypothetical protein